MLPMMFHISRKDASHISHGNAPRKKPDSSWQQLAFSTALQHHTCNHSLSNEVVVYLIKVLSPKGLSDLDPMVELVCSMSVYTARTCRKQNINIKCTGASDCVLNPEIRVRIIKQEGRKQI